MANVLFVSFTGALQPLGQSQVVQYLLALARDHKITLLSFESAKSLANGDMVTVLGSQCEAAGVCWIPLKRHNRISLGIIYDLVLGSKVAIRLVRQGQINVVHCRSYVAGLIGLIVKRRTGAKLLFDMRGLWPDERVDGDIWTKASFFYRAAKRVEKALLTNADHVVTITRAGLQEISKFDYLGGQELRASVIPTCTNTTLFRPTRQPKDGFVLGYVGSVGSWYRFEEVARAVARLFLKRGDARLLVINKGSHEQIRATLRAADVDLTRVTLREVEYDRVAEQISLMNAGIFFIKPVWSKKASCPTRMGEFLACGRPVLTNDGIGDVSELLAATQAGISIVLPTEGHIANADLDLALDRLLRLCSERSIVHRCRNTATQFMSLEGGVAAYDAVYRSLSEKIS